MYSEVTEFIKRKESGTAGGVGQVVIFAHVGCGVCDGGSV